MPHRRSGDAKGDQPTTGADGRRQILRRGDTHQPHRPRRGFLEHLQQHVGGAFGESVGILEEHDPPASPQGLPPARATSSRASRTPIDNPSGRTISMSPWVPARAVRQSAHCPQPPLAHCNAAANARAATERPEPGGPVNSPSMRHARRRLAAHCRCGRGCRGCQLVHRRLLADHTVEDGAHSGAHSDTASER